MQVIVNKNEVLNLVESIIMSAIKKAHFVTDASCETAHSLHTAMRKLRQDSYSELVFVPQNHTNTFDGEFLNQLKVVKWDSKLRCWADSEGIAVYFQGPGKFMERISELATWNIVANKPVIPWDLNSNLLPEEQVSSNLRPAQKLAARKVISNYSFIWGPPGTGKTFTSATILQSLLSNNCKVLVTSTANKAVDEIMDQLIEINPACDNRIARYGGDRIEQGRRFEIPRLQKQKLASREPSREAELIEKELTSASVIFANTMAVQCYPKFASIHFDYVLLDETSMIQAYTVEALRCLYPEAKFILAGDPMQLPPVIEDRQLSAHKYARSVYDYPEMQKQMKLFLEGGDSVISFLDIQSRMHSRLGSAISHAFYHGKLKSSKPLADKLAYPECEIDYTNQVFASGELTILGHKALGSLNSQETAASNANLLEATWVARGASWIKDNTDLEVLVISPFNNQVNLIKSLLNRNDIKVSTVHKAQGSQADIVLFSLAGNDRYNYFVDPRFEHVNEKLINVAFSRAKVQCIVVGREKHLSSSSALVRLQQAYVAGSVEVASASALDLPQESQEAVQAKIVVPKTEEPQLEQKVQEPPKVEASQLDQMKRRIEALEVEVARLEAENLRLKSSSRPLLELSSKPLFVHSDEEF
jgi:hypothetical protein